MRGWLGGGLRRAQGDQGDGSARKRVRGVAFDEGVTPCPLGVWGFGVGRYESELEYGFVCDLWFRSEKSW